jgi:hypothetical protein
MHWALAAVMITVVLLMMSNSARKLPWIHLMRRLRTSESQAAWMAPEHVVEKAQNDYMAAVEWLQDSPLLTWAQQWSGSPDLLIGPFLRRYQQILLRQRSERAAPCYGILRADHALDVRGFSEDGRRCWLIDTQHDRRIATYDADTHARLVTQDLGSACLVYCLFYDTRDDRWKIETLVQELPLGWNQRKHIHMTEVASAIPTRIGRDA